MKNEGIVLRYNKARQIGIIFSEGRRFFFHSDRILVGPPDQQVGDRVLFTIRDKEPLPGQLPAAQQIEVSSTIVTEEGVKALAGQVADPGDAVIPDDGGVK